jgi:hypothetical protein
MMYPKKIIFIVVLSLMTFTAFMTSIPAQAANRMCPYCAMPLGAPSTQVWLHSGSKKVAYRCVFCAVSEAKTEYKGNLSILAPTENRKKPLIIKRTGGHWSSNLKGASFVGNMNVSHKSCPTSEHAFTSSAAAKKYIAQHKDVLSNGMLMSFNQFIAMTK